MAQRRMFSPDIVDSDAFLDMPQSSQLLYFHLGMNADDDGFISPKKVMRMIGAADDDLKLLIVKRFVLPFQSGVVVIKHWLIHNLIRKDRYKETRYLEEKKMLIVKKNGSYTEVMATVGCQNDNQMATQVRLGKVRLGKENTEIQNTCDANAPRDDQEIIDLMDSFKIVNPSYRKYFGNTTQRAAAQRLVATHGAEKLKQVVSLLEQTNKMQYAPIITTPVQLEDNFAKLAAFCQRLKSKKEAQIPVITKIR